MLITHTHDSVQPQHDISLVNVNEVRRALQLLAAPGQVVEVRALEASLDSNSRYTRTYGGYFDNSHDLIKAISTIRHAMGIYITLHPCTPDILHRAKNKLVEQKKDFSTPDKYIDGLKWLAIDCDPERVSGISSTEEEHEKALAMCRKIRDLLKALRWPEPVLADSGNGGHLLYRIDLPTSDSQLLKRVLEGLQQYNEPDVHVDLTLFNPSRIIKLYGTLACKGDNTDERPHRLSRILEIPEQLQEVSREQLEAMAVPVEEKPPVTPYSHIQHNGYKPNNYVKENYTAEAFMDKHGIQYKSKSPWNGGTRYLLEACPFDSTHTDNSACVYNWPDGKKGFSCSHNSCAGLEWHNLKLYFEPDAYTEKNTKRKKSTNEQDDETEKEETALIRLMRIADEARLICTPTGALYARVPVNGHHEILSISERGSGFRRWLINQFKKEYGFAPNSDALSQTMSGVQADAEFDGEKADIYTRIAEKNGCIYLDLANDKWQCVEISKDGWRVITCPPVYFRRPSGMLPLPVPTTDGSLDDLRELINAKDERDYKLITAWLVGTLHPKGPYPVLNLNGERGSAKTKTTTILRSLVDPSLAPTRNVPKDDREAAITSQNNMVIALDNLSSMPLWLSDLLCRIATGSGFSARELYTDDSERVFNNRRPIIMNGIEDGIISQGDLLNRTMMVTLTPPDEYIAEEDIDELFREKHPSILGALLTVTSVALRDRRRVQLDNPPRMADFAKWITAAEPALGWQQGTFMDIYTENQTNATSIVMDASPVAKVIVQFMDKRDGFEWTGLIGDLLTELLKYEVYKDAKKAPKAAHTLSGHLKRIAPSMREQGIDIQHCEHTKKGRIIRIKLIKSPLPGDASGDASHKKGDASRPGDASQDSSVTNSNLDVTLDEAINSTKGDAGDASLPSITALYPPTDFEKTEKVEKVESESGVADRVEKEASPPSPDANATIPDNFIYEETECTDCGCGLTRQLSDSQVCVRCYPPKGYYAYKHLVDTMYPRKSKTEFGVELRNVSPAAK